MVQQVMYGTALEVQGGLYGGVSPVTYEEQNIANNGFNCRLTAARKYYNWFTQPFSSTGNVEYVNFKSGHYIVLSVSNPYKSPGPSTFTHAKLASGLYDTDIDAMFDNIAGLPFDSNVTSTTQTIGTTNTSTNITGAFTNVNIGANITGTGIPASTTITAVAAGGASATISHAATATGSPTATIINGITAPYVYFIYNHEQDAKNQFEEVGKLYYSGGGTKATGGIGTKDTATDFINSWIRIWNRWQLRAAAHGVPTSRVRFTWCMTAFGFSPDRITQYWPGGQYVDVMAPDLYYFPTSNNTSFAANNNAARTFAINKNKPMGYPEYNCYDNTNTSLDSTNRANGFTSAATFMANDTQRVEFICLWPSSAGTPYNWNKVTGADSTGNSYPNTHAAILTSIATLGGNPIRTGVTQSLPSAPAGVAGSSNAAGTTITMTWNAPPGGDLVTGWDVYINPGVTTNLHKDNATTVAVTPRSYTFTGLTPGTTYSISAVAINAAGRSGFGNIPNVTTSTPGPTNHAPNIASATAIPQSGNPNAVDFAATATDPDSNPITYLWTITAPDGSKTTLATATGTLTYNSIGNYSWSLAVADNGTPPLVTSQTGTFAIVPPSSNTPKYGWPLPLPGQDVRAIAPLLRGVLPDIDANLFQAQYTPTGHNNIHGFIGSSCDPASIGGTTVITMTSGTFVFAAVSLQGNTLNGLSIITGQAQSSTGGTGSTVALYDSNGNLLNSGVMSADAWLQGTAGPIDLTFPSAVSDPVASYGRVIYVGICTPSGITTYPTIRGSAAAGIGAKSHLTNPRWGTIAAQTTCPSSIPFGSWVNNTLMFVGVW